MKDRPKRDQIQRHDSLSSLMASKEIAVFCGSGGVGKTTMAAAVAAMSAAELGGRVLVLTVDPARRLATALGLSGIGNVETEVGSEVFAACGVRPRGQLFAAMLDTKRSWDDLVRRYAPDAETAYEILANPLYVNITSRFVNAHEYIAMERLYEIHASGKYDLIIVDTPPTRSALDFLDAPKRIAEFFGGRFLKFLTLPYRAGGRAGAIAVDFAARPFYRIADRVLGSEFMKQLGEFFLHFQTMNAGFVQRAREVDRLLHDGRTTFAVVTTLESVPLREAEFFCAKLQEYGFDLGAMILNRVLPGYFTDPDVLDAAVGLSNPAVGVQALEDAFPESRWDSDLVTNVLRSVGESYRNFSIVASREQEQFRNLTGRNNPGAEVIATVPQLSSDVADLAGLLRIGRAVMAPGRR